MCNTCREMPEEEKETTSNILFVSGSNRIYSKLDFCWLLAFWLTTEHMSKREDTRYSDHSHLSIRMRMLLLHCSHHRMIHLKMQRERCCVLRTYTVSVKLPCDIPVHISKTSGHAHTGWTPDWSNVNGEVK